MKLSRLWGAGFCAVVLSLAISARAADLSASGTVLGTDGKPLSGVTVSLAVAKSTTISDASGSWSLAAASAGIASRVATPVANSRLMLEDGRLSVRFDGRDVSGRGQGRAVATPRSLAMVARAADVPDTLLYSWSGTVRLRDTISASQTGIVRTLDTTLNPSIVYGYVTDSRDGQLYRTVTIGTQTWMAQNLNYRNTTGSSDTVGVCYNNSADSCAKYGRLYTWSEVMNGSTSSATSPSGVQGICPTGWHVPSDAEWHTLIAVSMDSATSATNLKSTSGWISRNGTDTYGFRALPGGYVSGTSFNYVGYYGYWWSATEYGAADAWSRGMDNRGAYVYRYNYFKTYGFSLRCSKD